MDYDNSRISPDHDIHCSCDSDRDWNLQVKEVSHSQLCAAGGTAAGSSDACILHLADADKIVNTESFNKERRRTVCVTQTVLIFVG